VSNFYILDLEIFSPQQVIGVFMQSTPQLIIGQHVDYAYGGRARRG